MSLKQSMGMNDVRACALRMLSRWAEWSEGNSYEAGDDPALRCYGPGYLTWGVQSNWNYVAAMATLSAQPDLQDAARWQNRALSALRFALATHVTGNRPCPDGKPWGHSWISMLGIERAMHGMAWLKDVLTPEDQAALRRVLVSEANWLLHEARRGNCVGVCAGKWAASGNPPESNIWSGCLLWRIALMYPGETAAQAWIERAHQFLINGVSVDADADSDVLLAGQPVRARHVGANFFPHYALDHHGYLNVGYMVICVSNIAMLHFDLKREGLERPASLDHHQADLWAVLRRLIFDDGRLARIGGDSRVRYAYCQEYLLPSLLYAADFLRDPHALELVARQVAWIERENEAGGDGSFYAKRLSRLRDANPHYYTRLESDRACVLAMLMNYLPLVSAPAAPATTFEESVAGDWAEPEHGAVMSRSPGRLASFSWRAFGLGQAFCIPPDGSNLAEWSLNLCPVVRFLGDAGNQDGTHRRLIRQHIQACPGGFVTCGSIMEGVEVRIDEGATCTDQAVTHLAFAALPDGHTCVGLQYVVCATDRIGILAELKALHLNLPNDLFNNFHRTLWSSSGKKRLSAPAKRDDTMAFPGRWINVDGRLGLAVLYGGDELLIDRAVERRAGKYRSLYVEEICTQASRRLRRTRPGETLIDIGYAIVSNADASTTSELKGARLDLDGTSLRGVWLNGLDGKTYTVVANFGSECAEAIVFGKSIRIPPGEITMEAVNPHAKNGS